MQRQQQHQQVEQMQSIHKIEERKEMCSRPLCIWIAAYTIEVEEMNVKTGVCTVTEVLHLCQKHLKEWKRAEQHNDDDEREEKRRRNQDSIALTHVSMRTKSNACVVVVALTMASS